MAQWLKVRYVRVHRPRWHSGCAIGYMTGMYAFTGTDGAVAMPLAMPLAKGQVCTCSPAVAMSLVNGLVGTRLASRYRLQPRVGLETPNQ